MHTALDVSFRLLLANLATPGCEQQGSRKSGSSGKEKQLFWFWFLPDFLLVRGPCAFCLNLRKPPGSSTRYSGLQNRHVNHFIQTMFRDVLGQHVEGDFRTILNGST